MVMGRSSPRVDDAVALPRLNNDGDDEVEVIVRVRLPWRQHGPMEEDS
jgi:hypothetical protein